MCGFLRNMGMPLRAFSRMEVSLYGKRLQKVYFWRLEDVGSLEFDFIAIYTVSDLFMMCVLGCIDLVMLNLVSLCWLPFVAYSCENILPCVVIWSQCSYLCISLQFLCLKSFLFHCFLSVYTLGCWWCIFF